MDACAGDAGREGEVVGGTEADNAAAEDNGVASGGHVVVYGTDARAWQRMKCPLLEFTIVLCPAHVIRQFLKSKLSWRALLAIGSDTN